ncbi:MAG: hypothetical protein C4586_08305 [Anaerolineaceae bacterium]|nr:MAG: hypothetical protein C4586_08305 [Anaerolineaceae bacterium]
MRLGRVINLVKANLRWLADRVTCFQEGHVWKHAYNLYGDQIMYSGGMRSVWKCQRCNKTESRKDLWLL